MIINGIDISNFGGKVIDKLISPNRVNNALSWDTVNPQLIDSKFDFKNISITLFMKAETEQEFIGSVSKLTELFRLGATVKFADIPYSYKCYVRIVPDITRLNHKQEYKVIFDCDAEFGTVGGVSTVTASNTLTMKVNNPGNYITPARVVLTARESGSNLYINGLVKNFTFTNVKVGDIIVVDGVTGEILRNGSVDINNFYGWNLPNLPIGDTTIKTNLKCDIEISYLARY